MSQIETGTREGDVWFAYDGDCPICTTAAEALQIREAVGALHLVNARAEPDHPLIQEINAAGLDLDDGMVLKFQGVCYHGDDALHMMALLGSPNGWFNRTNALLFRSRPVATLCYPVMRAGRNLLLRLKGVPKIRNLHRHGANRAPVFQAVFGDDWKKLPRVMREHYAVRPYSDDVVVVKGTLDVQVSRLVKAISWLSGTFISRSGDNVPVTVTFRSGKDSAGFYFDRLFHYPEGDQRFVSRMEPIGGDEVVEFFRFGVGWKVAFGWDGEKITLSHRGYVWRVLGQLIPIPLALLIGGGEAEEWPLSHDSFRMWAHAKHDRFGRRFAYAGTFKIVDAVCRDAS